MYAPVGNLMDRVMTKYIYTHTIRINKSGSGLGSVVKSVDLGVLPWA